MSVPLRRLVGSGLTFLNFSALCALTVVVWVLGTACAASDTPEPAPPQSQRGAARHAVHGVELERTMRRLNRLRQQRWPQEVEAEYEARRQEGKERTFQQAEQLAVDLAKTAVQIADAADEAEMVEADRRAFLAKVDVFRAQAEELQEVVGRRDAKAMRSVLREIDKTCQSCHARFREVTGPLG